MKFTPLQTSCTPMEFFQLAIFGIRIIDPRKIVPWLRLRFRLGTGLVLKLEGNFPPEKLS